MITSILALPLVRGALKWLAIAGVASIAFWAWGSYQHFSGFREGQTAERVAWEKAMADLRAEMDTERRKVEADIAEIERQYITAKNQADRQFREFDAAITAMEMEDAPQTPGCVCRPAIPRGLGLQLDAIGR
jgi:hypothetical protein